MSYKKYLFEKRIDAFKKAYQEIPDDWKKMSLPQIDRYVEQEREKLDAPKATELNLTYIKITKPLKEISDSGVYDFPMDVTLELLLDNIENQF